MIRRPPRSTLSPYTTLSRSRPNAGQHDHRIAVVQHLGVHEPGEHLAQDTARLMDWPLQHVYLIRLHQMLGPMRDDDDHEDRKSTRLNSSHGYLSYGVFCLQQ